MGCDCPRNQASTENATQRKASKGKQRDGELELHVHVAMESKRWRRASDEELVMVGEDATREEASQGEASEVE